ncbi:MAG: hypothetical protein R3E83_12270 [Burkholderiaceae bacterium]
MAPTVLFMNSAGEQAPRLVGYASDDFYWAYLSERITELRAAPAPQRRATPCPTRRNRGGQ